MSGAVDFEVRRADLRSTRFTDTPPAQLEPGNGQALLRVDHFAFTANNITYAAAGDTLSYWNFFPAERGWGRVPVWGFADVVASRCAGVREGARFYGYYPMSTHLVVEPVHANDAGFIDGAAHRASMAGTYNRYRAAPQVSRSPQGREAAAQRGEAERSASPRKDGQASEGHQEPDPGPGDEEAQMLFQPLFVTAFLIDDYLADSGFFGARIAVLSSASSKTAFGLAHQLAQRGGKSRAASASFAQRAQVSRSEPKASEDQQVAERRPAGSRAKTSELEVVGLTSPRNTAFAAGLGCYQRVLPYGDLAALDPTVPAVFVDMAGNGAVQSAVHHHFGANLVHSLSVGLTHWEHGKRESSLPGAQPTFFFAPNQLRKRFGDWGPEGFQQRIDTAFGAFRGLTDRALRVVRGRRADVQRVYLDTLEGRAAPDEGHVLSLQESQ